MRNTLGFSAMMVVLTTFAFSSAFAHGSKDALIKRGRYIIMTSGCNDCHSPDYMMKNGNVPETQWLLGSGLGWKGPWGTTYAANLRKKAAGMNEGAWVNYLKGLKTRPPMPYYDVNAMEEKDMKAVYAYIRSLGPAGEDVPKALPPNVEPTTPYIDMSPHFPGKK